MSASRSEDRRTRAAGRAQAKGRARAKGRRSARRSLRERARNPFVWAGLLLASVVGATVWLGTGCGGWDVREPLMRNAPEVDEAIARMDAGDYDEAAALLQDYLGTGACADGEMGVPLKARKRADGTFDLGLVLFHLGEKYGARFGDEELPAEGAMEAPEIDERRTSAIDCALKVVLAIAGDSTVAADLRARAHYLAGNLELLRKQYQAAVDHYDRALQLIPGIAADADGDPLGRDAAWNRAIALRRLQENPDAAPPDAEPDGDPDADPDGGDEGDAGDAGGEDPQDQSSDGGADDASSSPDAGDGEQDKPESESGDEPESPENEGDDGDKQQGPIAESGEESPEQSRMRMILDELEDAPTYQQAEAKRRRGSQSRRVMEDK